MAENARRRILIIGGTGTVGSNVLRELLPDRVRFDIVAAARSEKSAEAVRAAGHFPVYLDLKKPETVRAAMARAHTVFMLKPYGIDYLIQSKIIIDAAAKNGVAHIVNLGSHGADDTVWSPIGWNRLVEAYLKVSGVGHTTLRPNYFMNNVAPRTDRQSGEIIHYFGNTPVSWIAAEDIARAAAVVLRDPAPHQGRAYPLAVETRTMAEIAEILSSACGKPFAARYVPPDEAFAQLTARGWDADFARNFVAFMEAISKGQVPDVAETFSTVEELTGKPALRWRDFAELHRSEFV
ncbi:MAG TPA: NmrA family NAD(P)-binding protein [Rhizomicrobium sp.]|nr:NmrA family NAD(P)-binding protein [Rhizomicrobium sp.]